MAQSTGESCSESIRILEFYSGVGGMHFAAKACGVPPEVICAFDINPNANDVYQHNFGNTPVSSRNIEGLSAEELDGYGADAFLMSPPCQPYTRQGLQAGNTDPRARSFLAILDTLPDLQKPPRFLLLENVKGFETSETRAETIRVLQSCSYSTEEYLLSPLQCGIPNSRLRYYLLARRVHRDTGSGQVESRPSESAADICTSLPALGDAAAHSSLLTRAARAAGESSSAAALCAESCRQNGSSAESADGGCAADSEPAAKQPYSGSCVCGSAFRPEVAMDCVVRPIADFLDPSVDSGGGGGRTDLLLPDSMLAKHRAVLDVVRPSCCHSCCFTKNYFRYLRGTGSVLDCTEGCVDDGGADSNARSGDDRATERVLRFFSPREVANLMCFPAEFGFPASVTTKQQYRCLGNSLNVLVVAWLLSHLFDSSPSKNS